MKKKRLSERSIALVCAVVLVVVSVSAAVRQSDWFADLRGDNEVQSAESVRTSSRDDDVSSDELSTPEMPAESTDTDSEPEIQETESQPVHPEPSQSSTPKSSLDYSYTAVAGDSYTGFARQSIQEYADIHQIALSSDQILDAEVALANQAGQPMLEIDQVVTIAQADIQAVLPASQQSAGDTSESAQSESNTSGMSDFTYTAEVGDSYISLARDAIMHSGSDLTPAQRVAAETFAASQVGYPEIQVGQRVVFALEGLQQAVSDALALTPESQLVWEPYAAQIAW